VFGFLAFVCLLVYGAAVFPLKEDVDELIERGRARLAIGAFDVCFSLRYSAIAKSPKLLLFTGGLTPENI